MGKVKLRELQLRTLKAEFQSLQASLSGKNVILTQQVKLHKCGDVFGELNERNAGSASKVMKLISTYSAL